MQSSFLLHTITPWDLPHVGARKRHGTGQSIWSWGGIKRNYQNQFDAFRLHHDFTAFGRCVFCEEKDPNHHAICLCLEYKHKLTDLHMLISSPICKDHVCVFLTIAAIKVYLFKIILASFLSAQLVGRQIAASCILKGTWWTCATSLGIWIQKFVTHHPFIIRMFTIFYYKISFIAYHELCFVGTNGQMPNRSHVHCKGNVAALCWKFWDLNPKTRDTASFHHLHVYKFLLAESSKLFPIVRIGVFSSTCEATWMCWSWMDVFLLHLLSK